MDSLSSLLLWNWTLSSKLVIIRLDYHMHRFADVVLYFTLILLGKLTENTFSFTAMTCGIVTGERRGDDWANCKLGMIRLPWWYEGQIENLKPRLLMIWASSYRCNYKSSILHGMSTHRHMCINTCDLREETFETHIMYSLYCAHLGSGQERPKRLAYALQSPQWCRVFVLWLPIRSK